MYNLVYFKNILTIHPSSVRLIPSRVQGLLSTGIKTYPIKLSLSKHPEICGTAQNKPPPEHDPHKNKQKKHPMHGCDVQLFYLQSVFCKKFQSFKEKKKN